MNKLRNIKPKFIAHALIEIPKEIKKRYNKTINIDKHSGVLDKLNSGIISKDAVFEILVEIAHNKKVEYSKYRLMTDKELKREIKKIVVKHKNLPLNALIGKVMGKLRGKAPGKKIVDLVKKLS